MVAQEVAEVVNAGRIFLSFFILLFLGINAGGGLAMELSSPEFEQNTFIPVEFSCQGLGVNPPLSIEGIPKEAKSLTLIVDDPDAPGGNFVHWVVYNIPITNRIEKNSIPGIQGINSLGKADYASPCPPTGVHRYFFKIYALDSKLNLGEGVSKVGLEKAMTGHILDKAELIGLYKKK